MQNDNNLKIPFPGSNKKAQTPEPKQREKLPPFLMVRSGLFNEAILLAMVLIPLAEFVLTKKKGLAADFLYMFSYVIPAIVPVAKGWSLYSERKIIQSNLKKYANTDTFHLSPISGYDHRVMAKILTKYMSEHDSRLFENMMLVPKTVDDEQTALAIIQGYLKSHPDAAQSILDKFDSIPVELKKQLEKITAKQK